MPLFLLKKIVGLLFMPLSIILILFFAGMILLWFTHRQIMGKIILTITFLLFVLFGYGFLSYVPLEKLERFYPTLDINAAGIKSIRWVVVLAGDENETVIRLAEGIRIQRDIPGARLVVSGGRIFGPESSAERMAGMAADLGVNLSDIVLEDSSKDTKDEARFIRPIVNDDRFILVTSAYHMPRAMGLFRAQGMQPVPAPVAHLVPAENYPNPWMFFPGTEQIHASEVVIHEVLGIITAEIMGQM
jgi:uncharacterized SAM-binding protein YcdF (DUF218 family)